MDKQNYTKSIVRYFPLLFLLLLTIFILIKFAFVVLFRAAYDPQFIFDLTPYYLISPTNNIDLLLMSLLVVIIDVYLHFSVSKKNLIYSFIPTSIMLAGLGISVATHGTDASYAFHYVIFGCLLLIALIDQKQILVFQDMKIMPIIEQAVTKSTPDKTLIGIEIPDKPLPVFGQTVRVEGIEEILSLYKETITDVRTMIKDGLQSIQNMAGDLEKRTEKLNYLSEEIEERRKNLIEDEKIFRNQLISRPIGKIKFKPVTTEVKQPPIEKPKEIKIDSPTMLDDFLGTAAVVKDGALKQVSQQLVDLLGFDSNTLLEKNLVDLIDPESVSEFVKNYSNKSKNNLIHSYKTVFLTKDNKKIHVEITIKPRLHDRNAEDLVLITNLDELE